MFIESDAPDCSAALLLPQSCKHSKSADLLRKSLLSHVWRLSSSEALSCKHEQLPSLKIYTLTRITEVLPLQPTDRMVFGAKLKDVFTGSFPRASHQPAPLCTDACCYWFLSMHFLMNQSYLCSIQISAFFVKGLIYHQSYCPLRSQ